MKKCIIESIPTTDIFSNTYDYIKKMYQHYYFLSQEIEIDPKAWQLLILEDKLYIIFII